jgi:quinol monooxygenase YgiN
MIDRDGSRSEGDSMDRTTNGDGIVTVLVRGRLRDEQETARRLHDEVTGATRALAEAAGDISHRVFLDARDPKSFLGIDEWRSADAALAFASDPRITDFFGRLLDGPPEITFHVASGWNEWRGPDDGR